MGSNDKDGVRAALGGEPCVTTRRARGFGADAGNEAPVVRHGMACRFHERSALLLVEEGGLARRPGHDDAVHAGVEMGANVIGKGGAIQLARFVERRDYRSKHSLQR